MPLSSVVKSHRLEKQREMTANEVELEIFKNHFQKFSEILVVTYSLIVINIFHSAV